MLDRGKTVRQILEENLTDVTALDLSGVSLDAVLYYVNQTFLSWCLWKMTAPCL